MLCKFLPLLLTNFSLLLYFKHKNTNQFVSSFLTTVEYQTRFLSSELRTETDRDRTGVPAFARGWRCSSHVCRVDSSSYPSLTHPSYPSPPVIHYLPNQLCFTWWKYSTYIAILLWLFLRISFLLHRLVYSYELFRCSSHKTPLVGCLESGFLFPFRRWGSLRWLFLIALLHCERVIVFILLWW